MDYTDAKLIAGRAQAMQDAMANSGTSGIMSGQLNRASTPAIRTRVQEANKRLTDLSGKLSFLVSEVAHPSLQDSISKGDPCGSPINPTLTNDVDDLVREISRIEQHVARLASAISG